MEIITKYSIIGIEKCFIWTRVKSIGWEAQMWEAFELHFTGLQNGKAYKGKNCKIYAIKDYN